MSTQSVAKQFVELCNQLRNFDIMRTLYAADIVSVEPDGSQTAGQQAVIRKSESFIAGKSFDGQEVRGPYFHGPDQFAIHFVQKVTDTASGKRLAREEVGIYTVKNDKIVRENFYMPEGD